MIQFSYHINRPPHPYKDVNLLNVLALRRLRNIDIILIDSHQKKGAEITSRMLSFVAPALTIARRTSVKK